MKAIASAAVACLLAATSLTATVVPADAGGKYWKYNQWNNNHWNGNNKHYYSNGWNPGAALATGACRPKGCRRIAS